MQFFLNSVLTNKLLGNKINLDIKTETDFDNIVPKLDYGGLNFVE